MSPATIAAEIDRAHQTTQVTIDNLEALDTNAMTDDQKASLARCINELASAREHLEDLLV